MTLVATHGFPSFFDLMGGDLVCFLVVLPSTAVVSLLTVYFCVFFATVDCDNCKVLCP